MKCLTRNNIIELLVNDFQGELERAEIRKHLDECTGCREQYRKTEKEVEEKMQSAKTECALVQDNLLNYPNSNTAIATAINFNAHLADCDACQFIHQQVTKELSFKEANALDYPVPESLIQKIERLLPKVKEPPVKAPIFNLSKIVDHIVLTLAPAPAPAFLGSHIAGAAKIKIPARDLKVNVGAPGRVVKIFSMNNDELDRQVSDQEGMVKFEDFDPGTYQMIVEGFDVKDIQEI
jgi:predicted anti-sigma-YlaC factor YlaD